MAAGAAVVLVIAAAVYLAFQGRSSDAPTETAEQLTADQSTSVPSSPPLAPGVSPPPEGVYVRATLDGPDFVLSGVVPSADLAGDLFRSAEVVYSPNVRSDLMVDAQLEPVDWLNASPQAIGLLPAITGGTILISDSQVFLSGQAPSEESLARLEGALGQITGLPVVVGEVEITNLEPPLFVMAAIDGRVGLTGRIPSDEVRGLLVAAAGGAYGPENVEDNLSVDPGVYSSLWMYQGGPLLQAMSTFPEYEMQIEGIAFSGFIRGGVTFESGSAEFGPDYAQVLDVGVSVLSRDQSLQLVIEGHTDASGPAAANLALSQSRADAVLAYFVENGIDPGRLTAVGLGETVPVGPNDTVEQRARNRRIEFKLSPSS